MLRTRPRGPGVPACGLRAGEAGEAPTCSGLALAPPLPGDYLGGEAYWAGGLHLYTPLPFRPGQGGFGELFRTHFFLNAGNLCNLNYGERARGARVGAPTPPACWGWSLGWSLFAWARGTPTLLSTVSWPLLSVPRLRQGQPRLSLMAASSLPRGGPPRAHPQAG